MKEEKVTKKKSTTNTKKSPAKKSTNTKNNTKKASTSEVGKSNVRKTTSKETVKEEVKAEKKEVKQETEKLKEKKIKKSDLFLIVGLIVVIVIGCFLMKGEKEEPNYTLPLTLTGETGFHLLSYSEYQEKIDNGEAFVVVLSRESCSHCQNFLPVAEEFANDNSLPMYYVDTDTFSEDDWTNFEKSNTFLKKNSGNWGTPTTIVLAGNEAVDYIEGETDTDSLLKLYNEYFEMK